MEKDGLEAEQLDGWHGVDGDKSTRMPFYA